MTTKLDKTVCILCVSVEIACRIWPRVFIAKMAVKQKIHVPCRIIHVNNGSQNNNSKHPLLMLWFDNNSSTIHIYNVYRPPHAYS